jgi:hypothetical protein
MTRTGWLVYYLTAWIIGSVLMSVGLWVPIPGTPSALNFSPPSGFAVLVFCFYGLFLGAGPSLLGAFILRALARIAHWETPAPWVIAGTLLTVLEIFVLGRWGEKFAESWTKRPDAFFWLTFGPAGVLRAGWWLAIPVGAATSFILYRVHRAFRQGTAGATAAGGKDLRPA